MLGSWGIAPKIGCALTLFVVPVAYLLWSLIAAGQIVIDTARQEIQGELYLEPVRQAQGAMLRTMLDKGNAAELEVALGKLADAERAHGHGFDAAGHVAAVEAAIASLRAEPDDPARQAAATSAMDRLIGRLRDVSGLILDPQIDSFYVMDASAVALPGLTNQLARIGVLQGGEGGPSEDLAVARVLARNDLDHLRAAFEAAAATDSGGRLGAIRSDVEAVAADVEATLARMAGSGPASAALVADLVRLGGRLGSELRHLLERRIADAEKERIEILAVTAALFMLAGLGVALLLMLTVVRPIRAMTSAMSGLAGGNLTIPIPFRDRRDELGAMAGATEIFKEHGVAAVRRSDQVAALVVAFEHTSGQLADLVGGAASRLERAADALQEGAGMTLQQVTSAEAATADAFSSMQASAGAGVCLREAIVDIARKVDATASMTTRAVGVVDATSVEAEMLARAAGTITGIVALIDDIAGQTNLLALNATMEAARAGEAGRGFAVVAGEVKNLAGQTARATAEIAAQIELLQAAANTSIGSIRSVGNTVQEIDAAAAAIAARVGEQEQASRSIALHVAQAEAGAGVIASGMTVVTEAVKDMGTVAGVVLSAAQDLSQQANRLRQEVARFSDEVRAA